MKKYLFSLFVVCSFCAHASDDFYQMDKTAREIVADGTGTNNGVGYLRCAAALKFAAGAMDKDGRPNVSGSNFRANSQLFLDALFKKANPTEDFKRDVSKFVIEITDEYSKMTSTNDIRNKRTADVLFCNTISSAVR